MNDATLERLMMDAALGGLSEDVEELLLAHLSSDPAKMREAQELRAMVGTAREAMCEKCPAEPDLRQVRQRWRMRQAFVWGGRVAAMAACVLVGLLLARLRPAPVRTEVVMQQAPLPQAAVAVNELRPVSEGEMWSAQRIYERAIEANRNAKPARVLPRSFQ